MQTPKNGWSRVTKYALRFKVRWLHLTFFEDFYSLEKWKLYECSSHRDKYKLSARPFFLSFFALFQSFLIVFFFFLSDCCLLCHLFAIIRLECGETLRRKIETDKRTQRTGCTARTKTSNANDGEGGDGKCIENEWTRKVNGALRKQYKLEKSIRFFKSLYAQPFLHTNYVRSLSGWRCSVSAVANVGLARATGDIVLLRVRQSLRWAVHRIRVFIVRVAERQTDTHIFSRLNVHHRTDNGRRYAHVCNSYRSRASFNVNWAKWFNVIDNQRTYNGHRCRSEVDWRGIDLYKERNLRYNHHWCGARQCTCHHFGATKSQIASNYQLFCGVAGHGRYAGGIVCHDIQCIAKFNRQMDVRTIHVQRLQQSGRVLFHSQHSTFVLYIGRSVSFHLHSIQFFNPFCAHEHRHTATLESYCARPNRICHCSHFTWLNSIWEHFAAVVAFVVIVGLCWVEEWHSKRDRKRNIFILLLTH